MGLIRDYIQLRSVMKDEDFSGMSEAERAAEAERRRQEKLQEARRLQMEGNPLGRRREAEARILDFDPKQRGVYYNRLYFIDLTTFDHDEECKLPFSVRFCILLLVNCIFFFHPSNP